MKTCKKCNIEKSLSEFPKDIRYVGGYKHRCKECKYLYDRQWLKSNPRNQAKAYEAQKRWYSEKGKEYYQQWRNENRDLFREIDKTYKQNNKEKIKERKRLRRFACLDTDITLAWLKKLRNQTPNCLLCGVLLTNQDPYAPDHGDLDHITPLNVGGKHIMGNVRYICHLCNLKRPKNGCDT